MKGLSQPPTGTPLSAKGLHGVTLTGNQWGEQISAADTITGEESVAERCPIILHICLKRLYKHHLLLAETEIHSAPLGDGAPPEN